MHQSQLISKIPHILKEMYDADLLEEEVILGWAEKVRRGSISHTIPAKYLYVAYCIWFLRSGVIACIPVFIKNSLEISYCLGETSLSKMV